MIGQYIVHFPQYVLPVVASVTQFTCGQLDGFHRSFPVVFFLLKTTLDLNSWWSGPPFVPHRFKMADTNAHLNPASGDDEVYYMLVSRAGMRPSGLVCILLFAQNCGYNRSLTLARIYPDRCKPLVPAVVSHSSSDRYATKGT